MSSRTLRGLTLVTGAILMAAACTSGAPSTGPSASAAGSTLMAQLASGGDTGLFETRYLGHLGEDAVLFVGTNDGAAIAYLCDPDVGSRWFTGTAANGTIDLKDAKGGHITGSTSSGHFEATLAGVSGYDGVVSLAKSLEDFRVAREGNVPAGQLVGGLVRDGDVIRGVLNITATGLPTPSGATPSKTPITIGLQAKIGSTVDVKISTSPKLSTDQQRATEAAARDAAKRMQNDLMIMNVNMVILAVILVVIAIVVAVFTFGAGTDTGPLVSQIVTAVERANFEKVDAMTGALLTRTLQAFLPGVAVAVSASPISSAAPTKAPTLGTLTFGVLGGS